MPPFSFFVLLLLLSILVCALAVASIPSDAEAVDEDQLETDCKRVLDTTLEWQTAYTKYLKAMQARLEVAEIGYMDFMRLHQRMMLLDEGEIEAEDYFLQHRRWQSDLNQTVTYYTTHSGAIRKLQKRKEKASRDHAACTERKLKTYALLRPDAVAAMFTDDGEKRKSELISVWV